MQHCYEKKLGGSRVLRLNGCSFTPLITRNLIVASGTVQLG